MKFGGIIRGWYKKNKRALPWRSTSDPYHIWVSEVILQQTRVSQGLNYYQAFIGAFPDVAALAGADEDEVLNLWQGLGYYSRARNLHQAAKEVVEYLNGEIPRSYRELVKLKGVGDYTASAIASVCFGEPRAVVDGNVARVISRIFGVEEAVNSSAGSKLIDSLAMELLDREEPGNHNQAMMEFGALQCTPRSPLCHECPLEEQCYARRMGQVEKFPVKIPKRKPVERWIYYYIFICKGETVITRRTREEIWKSLYQFPGFESDKPLDDRQMTDPRMAAEPAPAYGNVAVERVSPPVKHQLSHRTITARFIHVRLDDWPDPLPSGWIKISTGSLDDYPVPRLINRYMEGVKI